MSQSYNYGVTVTETRCFSTGTYSILTKHVQLSMSNVPLTCHFSSHPPLIVVVIPHVVLILGVHPRIVVVVVRVVEIVHVRALQPMVVMGPLTYHGIVITLEMDEATMKILHVSPYMLVLVPHIVLILWVHPVLHLVVWILEVLHMTLSQ